MFSVIGNNILLLLAVGNLNWNIYLQQVNEYFPYSQHAMVTLTKHFSKCFHIRKFESSVSAYSSKLKRIGWRICFRAKWFEY